MYEAILNVLNGNTSAFTDIIKVYEKSIYNYLYRLCQNRDDALDLTQDTFIKVYNNLHKFNTNMAFRPWLYRIAHNNYVDYIRLKKDHIDIYSEEFTDFSSPEDIIISRDSMKSIDSFVKSLPYNYRAVFLLRTIDELSFKEIGSILKISDSSARMRYLRVRKKISSMLKGGETL